MNCEGCAHIIKQPNKDSDDWHCCLAKEKPHCGHYKSHQKARVEESSLSVLLCSETIEACAKAIDIEADKLEKLCDDYLDSGGEGPCIDYSALYRACSEIIRRLSV
jgi:hypothetical protein